MPKVYMNEAPVVQTVGAGGIGVSPPVPVEKVEKISGNTRGMEEVVPPVNRIPNPIDVDDGAVIQEKNNAWQAGKDLPDPTKATDGMVLAVEDGKYVIADSSVQTDVADLVADPYSTESTYDVGDIVVYQNKLYVCKTPIPTAEAWTAAHWDEKNMAEALEDGLALQSEKIDELKGLDANISVKEDGDDYLLFQSLGKLNCYICAYTGWYLRNDNRMVLRFMFNIPDSQKYRIASGKFKYRIIMYADGNNDIPFAVNLLDETNGTTVTDWYVISGIDKYEQAQPVNMSQSENKKSYVRLQFGLFDADNNLEFGLYTPACTLVRDGSNFTCVPDFNDERQRDDCIYRFAFAKSYIKDLFYFNASTIFSDITTGDLEDSYVGNYARVPKSAISSSEQIRVYALMGKNIGLYSSGIAVQSEKIDELEILAENAYVVDTATGSIASFPDGADNIPVKDLTVNIEPVQDLHGQANPYPAGGGKNKVNSDSFYVVNPPSGIALTSSNGTITVNGSVSSDTNFAFYDITLPTGTYYFSCNRTDISAWLLKGYTYVLANSGSFTVDDATQTYRLALHFTTGTTYTNATVSECQIELGTSATAYAPYSNICPITGWTGANVVKSGINIFDEVLELGGVNSSTGQNESSSQMLRSKNYISIKPNTVYFAKNGTISIGTNMQIRFYDASKNYIGYKNKGGQSVEWNAYQASNAKLEPPDNAVYMRFQLQTTYGTTYNNDISINYPSSDHDYRAYTGTTYSIEFPSEAGTVYGGTLDVTTGVLTVDRAIVTGSWLKASGKSHIFYRTGMGNKTFATTVKSDVISNILPTVQANSLELFDEIDYGIRVTDIIYAVNKDYTDASDFNAWASTNGLQVVYTLATPVTYQLTPIEVKTLLGYNNIWADAGDSTVKYRADTKKYIEKLTAPTEDDMVANNSIAANTYFMVGNRLFYSTTSIAAGATLTVGTNCQESNLAAALNAINS